MCAGICGRQQLRLLDMNMICRMEIAASYRAALAHGGWLAVAPGSCEFQAFHE